MRSLKDTIEYLTDRVNELKLENKQLSDELQEAMETIMDLTDALEEYRMLPKPTKPAPPMPSVKPYNKYEDKLYWSIMNNIALHSFVSEPFCLLCRDRY